MMKHQISSILLIVFCFCTIPANSSALWHNGKIPYVIDSNVTAAQHCLIHSAMYHIAWRSCVRFREKSLDDSNYLQFQLTNHHQNECVPLVLLNGNETNTKSTILLSLACFKMDTIVHLLMHSLGIYELQNSNSTGLTKQDTETVNRLYNCPNPVKFQTNFIKQFTEHFHECEPKDEVKYNLSIYLLTYNVDKQNPPENLTELFDFDILGQHDIYVVALQELRILSMFTTDPYERALDEVFWVRGYWRRTRRRRMSSSLTIFVRKEKFEDINRVQKQYITTDYIMTKGAIAISFYYEGLSFAFINAHLSPYESNYHQRLYEYRQIMDGMSFGEDDVLDYDYVFFMGDLNFHISTLTADQISSKIVLAQYQTSMWNNLLKYDQLNIAKSDKRAFVEFEEARITFAPTSEFDLGTDSYKEGKPAYTDRILYRSTMVNQVKERKIQERVKLRISHYDSIEKFWLSSHRPVRAVASVPEQALEVKRKLKAKLPVKTELKTSYVTLF